MDSNSSSFVYINHYALFTSENLKAFEEGQRFNFKYHREVQQFYDYRQTQVTSPKLNNHLIHFNDSRTGNLGSKSSTSSSQSSNTSSNRSKSQSIKPPSRPLSRASSSAQSGPDQSDVSHPTSVHPIPARRSPVQPAPTLHSISQPTNYLTPPPRHSSLYSTPQSTTHSAAHSTKSSWSASSRPASPSSSQSSSSFSLNSSFDSSYHESTKQSSRKSSHASHNGSTKNHSSVEHTSPNGRTYQTEKHYLQTKPTNQHFRQSSKIEKDQLLNEIRNFKFNPTVEKQQPPPKVPIFKLNSNPLLTSEHLHSQLDRVRQQMTGSTTGEETDAESQGQWDLI